MVCFFNELPNIPVPLALKFAPIKSTASSISALDLLVVPELTNWPVISKVPDLSPSKIGPVSADKENETLGSLLFSTTITLSPLSNVNSSALPISIFLAGPGAGGFHRNASPFFSTFSSTFSTISSALLFTSSTLVLVVSVVVPQAAKKNTDNINIIYLFFIVFYFNNYSIRF